MNQRELVSVHVKHRDRMVVLCSIQRRSSFLELVHEGVPPRSHTQREVHFGA
jgi:hypothetical protein